LHGITSAVEVALTPHVTPSVETSHVITPPDSDTRTQNGFVGIAMPIAGAYDVVFPITYW
jgi:hypothetical protein